MFWRASFPAESGRNGRDARELGLVVALSPRAFTGTHACVRKVALSSVT
jgi:hypothetical protein